MKKIYKYTLPVEGESTISMPIVSDILSIEEQHGEIVVYALVDIPDDGELITCHCGRRTFISFSLSAAFFRVRDTSSALKGFDM